jgi:hypothetical protein
VTVFECNTTERFGVTFITPKTFGLTSRNRQDVLNNSIAILGKGRPDQIIMTQLEFCALRVGCFKLLYKVLGDDVPNEERFVRAVASTSDELFCRAIQEKPRETLAAVKTWLNKKMSAAVESEA